jgi:hypothetical protein
MMMTLLVLGKPCDKQQEATHNTLSHQLATKSKSGKTRDDAVCREKKVQKNVVANSAS